MRMTRESIANLILRVGVAFAFLYPPLDAIKNPDSWIGYFPNFITDGATMLHVPELLVLHGFGVIEVIIALWILSGWNIRIPALVAAVMLIAIVAFNAEQFPVLFRDLAIAAVALSLACAPKPITTS
jgi:uncharacterized membrane protein YphA (DoxX/SURF4 family)